MRRPGSVGCSLASDRSCKLHAQGSDEWRPPQLVETDR